MKVNIRFAVILIFLLVTLSYISYFGIGTKGWNPENTASWGVDNKGLKLKKRSMVYSRKGLFHEDFPPEKFNIELSIKPVFPEKPSFDFIIQFYDGVSEDRLLIGQWGDSLVIMNGDDYSNRRREPKIYLKLDDNNEILNIKIVSDMESTKVFINGELRKEHHELKLSIPENISELRLIVGCSESSRNSWNGTLYSLALYDTTYGVSLNPQHDKTPLIKYDFTEGRGRTVHEVTGNGADLLIPEYRHLLKKDFLSWPEVEAFSMRHTYNDIVLNLLGFIPLGALLYLSAGIKYTRRIRLKVIFSLLTVFLISFSIEFYQAWIPSRSSSMLDLILNTTGGLAGIAGMWKLSKS